MYIAIERAKFNRLLSSHTQSSAKRLLKCKPQPEQWIFSFNQNKQGTKWIQTDGRLLEILEAWLILNSTCSLLVNPCLKTKTLHKYNQNKNNPKIILILPYFLTTKIYFFKNLYLLHGSLINIEVVPPMFQKINSTKNT